MDREQKCVGLVIHPMVEGRTAPRRMCPSARPIDTRLETFASNSVALRFAPEIHNSERTPLRLYMSRTYGPITAGPSNYSDARLIDDESNAAPVFE